MKLRIKGNSVRLRLTRSEVGEFKESGRFEEKTMFSNGSVLLYSLESSDEKSARAVIEGSKISVMIPLKLAKNWSETDQVSLESWDGDLRILVEKDFACLTERPHEDDSDAFDNPNLKC